MFSCLLMVPTTAQTYEKLYSFKEANRPFKTGTAAQGLTFSSDETIYGVTARGGDYHHGTVFKKAPNGAITTLVNFTGNGPANKGSNPNQRLIEGSDGNFYGTTAAGGENGFGTIFKMTPDGALITLVNFTGDGPINKGSNAYELVEGSDGNLYGTTGSGGGDDVGTIFKMTPDGVLTTLVSFTNTNPPSMGLYPGGLVLGSDGYFYGSTGGGGTNRFGTVFKMTPEGVLTTLVNFTDNDSLNKGKQPRGSLIEASDGNFYGVTNLGGTGAGGTVFKMTPSGGLTTLVNFVAFSQPGCFPNRLTVGSNGNFYGTNEGDSQGDLRTIFRVTPNGVLTTLISPSNAFFQGSNVSGGLVEGSDGSFYGTTDGGGTLGAGMIFRMTPAGVVSTVAEFTGAYAKGGSLRQDSLIDGGGGFFFGITSDGGDANRGTIFKIAPGGDLTTLFSFPKDDRLDSKLRSLGRLVRGGDGNIYGSTHLGGNTNSGTLFKMTPGGVLTTLIHFNSNSGAYPVGALAVGDDGSIYGTTELGGSATVGTIFKMTPSGVLTTLVSFSGNGATNKGAIPRGGLIKSRDGNFYGTTVTGGTSDAGTIFRMTAGGVLTTLLNFNGVNGRSPEGFLVEGNDGNFYGTTSDSANRKGTVFKMTPAGAFTTLVVFPGNATPFFQPSAGLALGRDGNLYGTRFRWDSPTHEGTVFRVTPAGVLTTVFDFEDTAPDGSPNGILISDSEGNLYGTTSAVSAAPASDGSIYRLVFPPEKPMVKVLAATNVQQTSAQLNGTVSAGADTTTVFFEYGTDGNGFPNTLVASPATVVGVAATPVIATLSGLTKGQQIFFRIVASNAEGTVVSGTRSFMTLTEPTVTLGAGTVLSGTAVNLGGVINAHDAEATAQFEVSTDAAFPAASTTVVPAAPSPVNGLLDTPVSANLGLLTPGTTYRFRLRGTSAGGSSVSAVGGFTTLALPVATAVSAIPTGPTSATVTGTANARGVTASVVVEYGIDGVSFPFSMSASPATVAGNTPTQISATLDGLAPGTTYFIRVRGTSTAGSAVGNVISVTTLLAPQATAGGASNLTGTSAVISGTVNARGSSTTVTFEYGTDGTNFPLDVAGAPSPIAGTADTSAAAVLTGLTPGTPYFYRVKAVSAAGTVVSLPSTFTTPALPVVALASASNIMASSARLEGSVNVGGSSAEMKFEIATDPAFTGATTIAAVPSPVSANGVVPVSALAAGLQGGTAYHFRLIATNAGGTAMSVAGTFTTPQVPAISGEGVMDLMATTATLHAMINANALETAVVFEYGSSPTSLPYRVVATPGSVTGDASVAVSATLFGLNRETDYYFRVRAMSAAGESVSAPQHFVTAAPATAVTGTATTTLDGVSLHGTFNGFGHATLVAFDYGLSPSALNEFTVAGSGLIFGATEVHLETKLTGLIPGQTYYFRATATNGGGATLAANTESFTVPINSTPLPADDAVFHSGAVDFQPLLNDADPDTGDTAGLLLDPELAAPPSRPARVLADRLRILYSPESGDSPFFDSLEYRVLDSHGGSATATVKLIEFANFAGSRSAQVPVAAAGGSGGMVTVQLGAGGTMTGVLSWQDDRYLLRDDFLHDGALTHSWAKVNSAETSITIRLQLSPETTSPQTARITGLLTETTNGVETVTVEIELNAENLQIEPGMRTGFIEPPDSPGASAYPRGETLKPISGDGFLIMTVGKTTKRQTRVVGRLPDGTAFSAKGLPNGTDVAFQSHLYRSKGIHGGNLEGQINAAQGALLAQMKWHKDADGGGYYGEGIDEDLVISNGLEYPATKKNQPPPIGLLFPPSGPSRSVATDDSAPVPSVNARLHLAAGDLPSEPTRDVLLEIKGGHVKFAGFDPLQAGAEIDLSKLKLKLNSAAATYAGSFLHPGIRKTVKFHGAFRAEAGSVPGEGRGVFQGPSQSGSARILVSP